MYRRFHLYALCLLFLFFTSTVLTFYGLSQNDCSTVSSVNTIKTSQHQSLDKEGKHNLAVLVPFRDRFEELLKFVPHMSRFLHAQNISFEFFVLNQVDGLRFNRASLVNAGYKLTNNRFDYIAIHDVDLLPLNSELRYDYPIKGVFHVSSPELHPKYHYSTFLGGILLIQREVFEKVNGMSNRYWGWGLEDDELYTRLKAANIVIDRPSAISTNRNNTFLHVHDRQRRRRDTRKCFNQLEVTRHRDRFTGLHDVKFEVNDTIPMSIRNVPLTVINIILSCNQALTPWCQCDGSPSFGPVKKSLA